MTQTSEQCRHCGAPNDGAPLDRKGWCGACRARVAARAQTWAWVGAGLALLIFWGGTLGLGLPVERWIVGWAALGGILAFVAFKISRRMAFEVIQSHAIRSAATGGR